MTDLARMGRSELENLFCCDACEVAALRWRLAESEERTAQRIADYLRRAVDRVDAEEARVALFVHDLADDIDNAEWRKLVSLAEDS